MPRARAGRFLPLPNRSVPARRCRWTGQGGFCFPPTHAHRYPPLWKSGCDPPIPALPSCLPRGRAGSRCSYAEVRAGVFPANRIGDPLIRCSPCIRASCSRQGHPAHCAGRPKSIMFSLPQSRSGSICSANLHPSPRLFSLGCVLPMFDARTLSSFVAPHTKTKGALQAFINQKNALIISS